MLLVVCGMARVMPAVAMAVPDIPHGLKIRMDSLQKADNLELWVYTWIDALLEDPAGRYQWPGEAQRQAWRAPATSDEQRSEEHTSELQSLMRISYAVFCLKKQ